VGFPLCKRGGDVVVLTASLSFCHFAWIFEWEKGRERGISRLSNPLAY
jgi:hypothetical protein